MSSATHGQPPELPVVVGADGSQPNASAVAWAAAEASGRDTELVLLCAVGEELVPGAPWAAPEMDAAARAVLERVRRDVATTHPALTIRTRVAIGSAPAALVDDGAEAAVVVVGRRGHGGFARLLIGSTSMATAGRAHSPVVVVPQDWDEAPAAGTTVVIAVDPQQPDSGSLRFAFERARRFDLPLRAVTAWQVPAFLTWDAAGIEALWKEQEAMVAADLQRVITPWAARYPDVATTTLVVHGHPVGAVLEQLDDAELLVVAPRGRGTLGGFRLGSVSRGLLHHSPVPIAVVHPPLPPLRPEDAAVQGEGTSADAGMVRWPAHADR